MDPGLLHRYASPEGAAAYRRKYTRSLLRKLSNRRELALVDRALGQARAHGRVLDCPCGAGRLVPTILKHADHVTAVDLAHAMVTQAEEALAPLAAAGHVDFAVASVDDLPFEDGTFDTAVCHRLIHHIADVGERAAVLAELARVARRRVILSFGDATTWKRRVQARRGKTRRRIALEPALLRGEAAAQGLVLEEPVRRLNGLFSLVAVAVFDVVPPGRA